MSKHDRHIMTRNSLRICVCFYDPENERQQRIEWPGKGKTEVSACNLQMSVIPWGYQDTVYLPIGSLWVLPDHNISFQFRVFNFIKLSFTIVRFSTCKWTQCFSYPKLLGFCECLAIRGGQFLSFDTLRAAQKIRFHLSYPKVQNLNTFCTSSALLR